MSRPRQSMYRSHYEHSSCLQKVRGFVPTSRYGVRLTMWATSKAPTDDTCRGREGLKVTVVEIPKEQTVCSVAQS